MSIKKSPERKIVIYDTTLRDGTQAEDISFSVEDKVRIALRLDELGIDYIERGWPGSNPKDPLTHEILNTLKKLENQGYQYEGAEASFELIGFRILSEKLREDRAPVSEATIMIKVGGKVEHTAATGNGPVNALDNAIRKALEKFYPQLTDMELVDYKVRVLSAGKGTASKVRVLIESGDHQDKWGTVGVSENIIEASWQALVDSINYKLLKDEKAKK
jgi:2-isopropylmalate synthase